MLCCQCDAAGNDATVGCHACPGVSTSSLAVGLLWSLSAVRQRNVLAMGSNYNKEAQNNFGHHSGGYVRICIRTWFRAASGPAVRCSSRQPRASLVFRGARGLPRGLGRAPCSSPRLRLPAKHRHTHVDAVLNPRLL